MIEQHSPYIEIQWIVSNNHKTFVVNSNQGKINQGLAVHQFSISSRKKKKLKLKGTAIWYFYTDNISSFSCCSRSTLEITPNKYSPRLVIHIKLNGKKSRNWFACNNAPITRVVFTREKFLHYFCFLQSGNLSDSNNPLTKMHTLTHSGHLKYNVEKWKKSSTKFNIIFLAIMFALN